MNTRIIMILTMLLLWCMSGYAQQSSDREKVQGRWEMVKVEATLLSQGDDKVLEQKVLTARDSINMAGGMIPWSLWFEGTVCTVESNGRVERDSCRFEPSQLLLWEPGAGPVYYISWRYVLTGTNQLVLHLPAVFYMDPQRKVPVKRQFICTYGKKG